MQKEMFSHRSDRTNTFQVQLYVQLRTVPNAIITDDTQPRTLNQFSIILRLHHAVRPPVFLFGPCEAIQAQQQLGGRSFSPLLVPAGAEFNGGAGADVVGGGGQTRDTYNDDFLDILEPDADKQLK